ncbi:MAG: sugar-binding transcriptional regulator [Thermomicrobiales bacterium]
MELVSDDSVELMTSVSRMYYLDGLDQQAVADILGVSRSKVSRLLTAARERGVVRISVDDYDPRDRALEHQLVERFGLHHAVVVKTIGRASENVRRTIGYFAAPAVTGLIDPKMTVGLAGGRTLRELISCMEPRELIGGIGVVQLMGNIGPTPSAIDAVELSRLLAHRFAGTFYTLNAPAFLQNGQARELLTSHEHIRLVQRMFAALDLALVGIGSFEDSAFAERGALTTDDFGRLRARGAVGEICGRFYDRTGRECDTEYRDRVISIELDQLRQRPEVFGVTNGTGRTAATLAAITGRLVTSIVIDDRGAAALLGAGDR